MSHRREVYLDYQASTPCDPEVLEAMLPHLLDAANPASAHRAGTRAQKAIDRAREQVAEALGCFPREIIFTSGATESNNLALLGAATPNKARRRIVTTPIEHSSVLGPCRLLNQQGLELNLCPVHGDGRIALAKLSELLDENVHFVSVQLANNEIGTIQPISEIAQLSHRVGALVHVDAAQAFGKVPIDVDDLDVDLLSLSAHKCYGPKGIGALYVRDGAASGILRPSFFGGGHEAGLRPGTQNVPAIVGFGVASALCHERLREEAAYCTTLRDRLEEVICGRIRSVRRNGALARRLPNATSLTFPDVDGEAIMANAPELALSSSAACTSGTIEPSHVLQAVGLDRGQAYRTLRMSVGRYTTVADIQYAGNRIASITERLHSG